MKKILLITMLALSLHASICWSLEVEDFVEFDWVKNPRTPINGVDKNYRLLHAYFVNEKLISCYYTDSEFR
mgnify:CR=1 FL=1